MTYDYYIFDGTHDDFLKLGNPYLPKTQVEEAFHIAFRNYQEHNPEPNGRISDDNPLYALERLKHFWERSHPSEIEPRVLIIANKGKYLQSWQTGFTKYFPKSTLK